MPTLISQFPNISEETGDMVFRVNLKDKSELSLRIISASIIMPLVIGITIAGYPYFNILILIATVILLKEYIYVCNKNASWMLFGTIYILTSCFSLNSLSLIKPFGVETVLALFAIVWASDTGAFAIGRIVGGKKLAPKISPNKTWAGFFGGTISSIFIGFSLAIIFAKNSVLLLGIISGVIGVISQVGDLIISWVKRNFNKKDTGKIIPGHGGLLDRVDGLLPASFFVWIVGIFFHQKSFLLWF